MDRVEEVKKILIKLIESDRTGYGIDAFAQEICQLFEPKSDEKLYEKFPIKKRHIVSPTAKPYEPMGGESGVYHPSAWHEAMEARRKRRK